ncbi:MAG: hypothetical protein JXO22_03215 [Phycisphaerae bacterium]|nr:hypothetical protein [Phycisphaerae bacterium]
MIGADQAAAPSSDVASIRREAAKSLAHWDTRAWQLPGLVRVRLAKSFLDNISYAMTRLSMSSSGSDSKPSTEAIQTYRIGHPIRRATSATASFHPGGNSIPTGCQRLPLPLLLSSAMALI